MMHEWSTMKRLIYLRGNPATGGGGGSPLTVSLTAGAAPMLVQTTKKTKVTSCAVSFAPWQEGSGDPSPENIRPVRGWRGVRVHRTGTNIWDEEWEVGRFDTTTGVNLTVSDQIRTKNKIPIIGGASYFFSAPPSYAWFIFFDAEGNVLTDAYISGSRSGNSSSIYSGSSFTAPNNARYMRFYLLGVYGDTYKNDIAINYPSSVTTYAPYTGDTTEISFGGHTKNILDTSSIVPWTNQGGLTLVKNSDGSFTVNGTATELMYHQITVYLKAGTYTMSGGPAGGSSSGYSIFIGDGLDKYDFGNGSTFTVQNDGYYRMACPRIVAGTVCNNLTFKPMIEAGSTATPYEPYGTIYGGNVDVVTGSGEKGYDCIDLGSQTWYLRTGSSIGDYFYCNFDGIKWAGSFMSTKYPALTDIYKITSRSSSFVDYCLTIDGTVALMEPTQIQTKDSRFTTTSDYKNGVKGVRFAYEMKTPTPLTLPTASLTIPKGDNYVWAEMIP